jgi:hypothetical protein
MFEQVVGDILSLNERERPAVEIADVAVIPKKDPHILPNQQRAPLKIRFPSGHLSQPKSSIFRSAL